MPTFKNRLRRSYSIRKVWIVVLAFALLLIFAGIWIIHKHTSKESATQLPVSVQDKNAKTTSTQPTAQSDYTGGSPKGQSTPTTQSPEATVTDNNGVVSSTPPSSQWTTSPNGVITVYSPAQNSVLKSGDTLSGASSASRIYFRLIDNVSGVIAQGSISVVNGKFSGKFNFSTTATQGRVDVFEQNANGVESSNVSVSVRFN